MNDMLNFFLNNRINTLIFLTILIILLIVIFVIIILKEKKQKINNETIEEISSEENINIKEMLSKMEQNLKEKEVVTFEEEQEEKSIISYEELLNTVKEKRLSQEEPNEKQKVIEKIKTGEKFQNTDFISPIFGKQEHKLDYPTVKAHLEQKQKEKFILDENQDDYVWVKNTKNEEFLISLKEFRKNLE